MAEPSTWLAVARPVLRSGMQCGVLGGVLAWLAGTFITFAPSDNWHWLSGHLALTAAGAAVGLLAGVAAGLTTVAGKVALSRWEGASRWQ